VKFTRFLEAEITKDLYKGKTIIVFGARQTGKTTLCRGIVEKTEDASYFLCEEPDVLAALSRKSSTEMGAFLGRHKLVVLDEAQRLPEPGVTLKILHDSFPQLQVVATGSSSFELASRINEPMTGRKLVYHLPPLSLGEIEAHSGALDTDRLLKRRIIFGTYPEIVVSEGSYAERLLEELCSSYLFKDILALDKIRNPAMLEKLLEALAYQIGNEVSYTELAQLVGANHETVDRYIRVLEQAFIVFRLSSFSRNLRNELKKNRKIYFWDTGIRNALIRNFNEIDLRPDRGALWENFIIAERMKRNGLSHLSAKCWFWRAAKPATGEIDYLEERNGVLSAWEMKWKEQPIKVPALFTKGYPATTSISCVAPSNWREFINYSKH